MINILKKKIKKKLKGKIKAKKNRFLITDFPMNKKRVLVRFDYNVPLNKRNVIDNEKIRVSLPTIKYLLKKDSTIILMSHLGRPKGKHVTELSLRPVARELQKLLPNVKIKLFHNCIGKEIKNTIDKYHLKKPKKKTIFLLENLRFYKEEKENDYSFAHCLADLADFYINDAFAVSHRNHASVSAITKFLPSSSGFLLETELLNLSKGLKSKKPSIWIIGGAKLKKIDLIKTALEKADKVLIGGALAFSFLKAKKIHIGNSLVDHDSILVAKKLLKSKHAKKIILPVDFVCTKKMSANTKIIFREFNDIKSDEIGLDLGPKTVQLFSHYFKNARTIIWNGPLGYFELKPFQKATRALVKAIIKSRAFTICGGGETIEVVKTLRAKNKFSFVSTGGGASLALLSGHKMPALSALRDNYRHFGRK
jgi:phosphoglycerate kinase